MILTSRNLPKHSARRSAFTLIELIVVVALLCLAYTAFTEGWLSNAWHSIWHTIADTWYWGGWLGKLILGLFPIGVLYCFRDDTIGQGVLIAAPSILLILYYGYIDKGTPYEKLNVRNGITYKINSQKPYSGKVIWVITEKQATGEEEDHLKAGAKFEYRFRKGLLYGKQRGFYSNGQKAYETYSNMPISWATGYGPLLRSGDRFFWSSRGPHVKLFEELNEEQQTKRDVFRWTMWHKNGQKQWEAEIIDGIGADTSWYKNGEVETKTRIAEYEYRGKERFNERGGHVVTVYSDDLKGQGLTEYVRNQKPEYKYGSITVLRKNDSTLERAELIDVFPVKSHIRFYANGQIERKLTNFGRSVSHEGYTEDGARSYRISQSLSSGKYGSGLTFGEFDQQRETVKDGNGTLTIYWSKDLLKLRERVRFKDGEIVSRERWGKDGNQVK